MSAVALYMIGSSAGGLALGVLFVREEGHLSGPYTNGLGVLLCTAFGFIITPLVALAFLCWLIGAGLEVLFRGSRP